LIRSAQVSTSGKLIFRQNGQFTDRPFVPNFEHTDELSPDFIQCVVDSMQASNLLILAVLQVVSFVAQLNISSPQLFVCRFNLLAIYVLAKYTNFHIARLAFPSHTMTTQQVYTRGIYHGLPVFPEDVTGLTAIITGANGISGHHMLRVLSQSPRRWSKIYCLSRRPPIMPDGMPSNAEHIPLDFMVTPEEISKVLIEKNIRA
jgi:hypothetical protein